MLKAMEIKFPWNKNYRTKPGSQLSYICMTKVPILHNVSMLFRDMLCLSYKRYIATLRHITALFVPIYHNSYYNS